MLISHGASVNYEMGKLRAEIEWEYDKEIDPDKTQKKYTKVGDTYRIVSEAVTGTGPEMRGMSADDYRKMMADQGIIFSKVVSNG